MNTSSFSVLFGIVALIVFIFGSFIMHGGNIDIIVEALPGELMAIVLAGFGATYILTSSGGPGIFASLALALKGRRFTWEDYRALAAMLNRELSEGAASATVLSNSAPRDHSAAQMIRDAKALTAHRLGADQIAAIFQSRIASTLAGQRRGVEVLKVLGKSLLWFAVVAFALGAVHTFGAFSEPLEVIGGMFGSAATAFPIGIVLAAGIVLPLAHRLDAIVALDANFYEFIRTAFVCRVAGGDAALAVRTANGALPADLALNEGELDSLSVARI